MDSMPVRLDSGKITFIRPKIEAEDYDSYSRLTRLSSLAQLEICRTFEAADKSQVIMGGEMFNLHETPEM
jgi:hypothetical protein